LMRLAAHLDVAGKMPLTDFCNRHFRLEHPTSIARLPSPQLAPRRPPPPSESRAFRCFKQKAPNTWGSTASDRLSAIRPRVKQRLTAPPQLQPDPSPFAPRNGGEIGPCPEAAATSTRRSQPSLKRKIRPLTLLSPSAIRPENRVSYGEPKTASPALASTRAAFPARSAFHRHVRRPHSQASPATDPAALPPRSGFRRSFAPPMLSHERARSSSIARAIRPGSRGPRAACRLLQPKRSLSTTA
jgi:hypothetical protein